MGLEVGLPISLGSLSAMKKEMYGHIREVEQTHWWYVARRKIVFDWVIAASGKVSSARQAWSSVRSSAISNCILQEIRGWRFPKPDGGSVQVRYPFVFRSRSF